MAVHSTPTHVALPAAAMRVPHTRLRTPWQAERVEDLDDFLQRCEALERERPPTPFQNSAWLRTWYTHLTKSGDCEALLISLKRQGDSADAVLLPWVQRRVNGRTVIEPADRGITDYNGPLVRSGEVFDRADAKALWRSLRPALAGADLLRLDKLLPHSERAPNPLAMALAPQACSMFGNQFSIGDDYAAWMAGLGKHARKEFERQWRVFSRYESASFVRATTVEEGLVLLRQLAELQHRRREQTPGYFLDQPEFTAFYEHFLRDHLISGRCVITALRVGDETISGLYSVYDGERMTMLRVAMGGDAWKACAPGKLLLERSIAHLHAQGCREFDFAIGDYLHKRVFQTTARPLRDACVPLSVKGVPMAAAWRVRQALRQHDTLRKWVNKLRAWRR